MKGERLLARAGVVDSVPDRIGRLMLGLGFELVDVLDEDHPSKCRLVFKTEPAPGTTLFTTISYEDTMERPT